MTERKAGGWGNRKKNRQNKGREQTGRSEGKKDGENQVKEERTKTSQWPRSRWKALVIGHAVARARWPTPAVQASGTSSSMRRAPWRAWRQDAPPPSSVA